MKKNMIVVFSGVMLCAVQGLCAVDWENPPAPATFNDFVDDDGCKEGGGKQCDILNCFGFHYSNQYCCCGMKNVPVYNVSPPIVLNNLGFEKVPDKTSPATGEVAVGPVNKYADHLKTVIGEVRSRVDSLEKTLADLVKSAAAVPTAP